MIRNSDSLQVCLFLLRPDIQGHTKKHHSVKIQYSSGRLSNPGCPHAVFCRRSGSSKETEFVRLIDKKMEITYLLNAV